MDKVLTYKEIRDYLEEIKTVDRELIDNPTKHFITTETYKCELKNGKVVTREKILKNGKDGGASIIFPITTDNKVILAMEPRVFTKETVDIGLPAGYIEENEEPMDAAIRELKEETGYEVGNIIELGNYYQDQGCSGALNYYYLATGCRKVSEQKLDKDEYVSCVVVDLDEIDKLLEMNLIKGLNSIYLIEKGKRYLKEM